MKANKLKWFGVICLVLLIISGLYELTAAEADHSTHAHFWRLQCMGWAYVSMVAVAFYSVKVYAPFACLVLLSLLVRNRVLSSLLAWAVLHSSRCLAVFLKFWYERTRPDMSPIMTATGYSFPGGYTMNATAVLGCVAYLAITEQRLTLFQKLLLIMLMTVWITMGVPVSFHSLSGSWAGFWAGSSWGALCILFHHQMRLMLAEQG